MRRTTGENEDSDSTHTCTSTSDVCDDMMICDGCICVKVKDLINFAIGHVTAYAYEVRDIDLWTNGKRTCEMIDAML